MRKNPTTNLLSRKTGLLLPCSQRYNKQGWQRAGDDMDTRSSGVLSAAHNQQCWPYQTAPLCPPAPAHWSRRGKATCQRAEVQKTQCWKHVQLLGETAIHPSVRILKNGHAKNALVSLARPSNHFWTLYHPVTCFRKDQVMYYLDSAPQFCSLVFSIGKITKKSIMKLATESKVIPAQTIFQVLCKTQICCSVTTSLSSAFISALQPSFQSRTLLPACTAPALNCREELSTERLRQELRCHLQPHTHSSTSSPSSFPFFL